MEAYSKVQIQFSTTGKLINKKWLNSRSTAASSQKAPSRNLLLSSHPLKEQQAQLSYLLLVKPISKLLPGWSKEGAMEEGRFLPASLLPSGLRVPRRIIVSCPDLLGRLRMKPTHLHGGNICKKEHGEGCIITSPRRRSIPTDLILGTKLKTARCQRCSWFLGEGVIHAQATLLTPRPACGSRTADTSHGFNSR